MYKHQEALKTVEKSCISIAMEFNFGELFEEDEKALSTLQELVDKATPKKTIKENYEDNRYNMYKHYCPTCKYVWVCDVPNYCSECGQALDWSDEDDK